MQIISLVVGGVGLFLLGMILMTDGLKAMAGGVLRALLSRFTRGRFSACAAGVPLLPASSGWPSTGSCGALRIISLVVGGIDEELVARAVQRGLAVKAEGVAGSGQRNAARAVAKVGAVAVNCG